MSDTLRPHEPQHARPPCPSPTAGVHPNPYPLSRWCYPAISYSVVPFSSCPQSFPASGSSQMSHLFTSSSQSIGVSFFFLFFFFSFISLFFTLQYCIGFAIRWHESAMGVPSWISLPPPSLSHPYGSSQYTSPKHPVHCIEPRLVIRFLYDIIYVSMAFSQTITPSPSPTESKRLFYTSVSLLLSCIQVYHYHLSKYSMYIYLKKIKSTYMS